MFLSNALGIIVEDSVNSCVLKMTINEEKQIK